MKKSILLLFAVAVLGIQTMAQPNPNCGIKFDCFLVFYFTDGTQQTVSLQEMNLTKEGLNVFAANADVHISKNFPSVFPDPENPAVLPAVK